MFPSFRKKRSKTIAHFRNILLLLHKNMTVKAKRKNFEDMQKQNKLIDVVQRLSKEEVVRYASNLGCELDVNYGDIWRYK